MLLPCHPDEFWGPRDRYSVSGTIGEHPWRGKVDWVDGEPVLPLGPVWIKSHGLEAGDVVQVVLQPEGMQSSGLPGDIAEGLRDDPETRLFFDSLRTYDRNNLMRWVESANRPETRARRVAELIAMLKDRRFTR